MHTRSGVRTHADIRPLELKSNALTTRPSWLISLTYVCHDILSSDAGVSYVKKMSIEL